MELKDCVGLFWLFNQSKEKKNTNLKNTLKSFYTISFLQLAQLVWQLPMAYKQLKHKYEVDVAQHVNLTLWMLASSI